MYTYVLVPSAWLGGWAWRDAPPSGLPLDGGSVGLAGVGVMAGILALGAAGPSGPTRCSCRESPTVEGRDQGVRQDRGPVA
jgi:hypothetical protein